MMRCEMIVAAHKPYPIPVDGLLLPMRVGAYRDAETWLTASGKPYLRDDDGANISRKNDTYCELTAHWWLWQHSDADALGLCHYRRYFRGLTHEKAERLLQSHDLILPKKRHYWIETNYDQYAHSHHACDLETVRQVLTEGLDARYVQAFDRVMHRRSGHRFNMLLAKRQVFCDYSEWLFDVLAQVEVRLDVSGYSEKDRRVFGYLAERLLDVWLEVNPQRIIELPVLHTESQHWPRKIARFILRKIKGTLKH